MKKENFIILTAFIICVAVISIFIFKNSSAREEAKQREKSLETIKNLTQENAELKTKIKELETENNISKKQLLETAPAAVAPNKTNTFYSFGEYQPFIPYIQKLLDYSKTHKFPLKDREEFKRVITFLKPYPVLGYGGYQEGSTYSTINLPNKTNIDLFKDAITLINFDREYFMKFSLNGEATCVAKSQKAYLSCQNLGGTNPTPNIRNNTWLEYKLPARVY